MVGVGAAIGVVIIIVDQVLESKGSSFRAPILAVAVGIYLPYELSSAILAGGLIAHFAARAHAGRDGETSLRHGMLFAAGLITGEALVGILMAVPIVLAANADVLAIPEPMRMSSFAGLVVIAIVMHRIYRIAAAKD